MTVHQFCFRQLTSTRNGVQFGYTQPLSPTVRRGKRGVQGPWTRVLCAPLGPLPGGRKGHDAVLPIFFTLQLPTSIQVSWPAFSKLTIRHFQHIRCASTSLLSNAKTSPRPPERQHFATPERLTFSNHEKGVPTVCSVDVITIENDEDCIR